MFLFFNKTRVGTTWWQAHQMKNLIFSCAFNFHIQQEYEVNIYVYLHFSIEKKNHEEHKLEKIFANNLLKSF